MRAGGRPPEMFADDGLEGASEAKERRRVERSALARTQPTALDNVWHIVLSLARRV